MATDVKDFSLDVVKRSFQVPVLVDFWAAWCAPCKVLGPVLEHLEGKGGGRWILAKVDTEEFQEVARKYRVASIPNVKLFVDGNVTAEFVGALPESHIERWLKKSLPSKYRRQLEEAAAFIASGQVEKARKNLREILQGEPENGRARVLLARTLIFTDPEGALREISEASDAEFLEETEAIRTMGRLFLLLRNPEELAENPLKGEYLSAADDLQKGRFSEALEKFIQVIRRNRSYDEDGSRKACIAIFKFLGEEHEITLRHRREFSSALY